MSGSLLFIGGERGTFQVADTSVPEGKVLQEFELKDTLLSTPAISGGSVFVRSDGHLWMIQ
jgi:hypothetical protein